MKICKGVHMQGLPYLGLTVSRSFPYFLIFLCPCVQYFSSPPSAGVHVHHIYGGQPGGHLSAGGATKEHSREPQTARCSQGGF